MKKCVIVKPQPFPILEKKERPMRDILFDKANLTLSIQSGLAKPFLRNGTGHDIQSSHKELKDKPKCEC